MMLPHHHSCLTYGLLAYLFLISIPSTDNLVVVPLNVGVNPYSCCTPSPSMATRCTFLELDGMVRCMIALVLEEWRGRTEGQSHARPWTLGLLPSATRARRCGRASPTCHQNREERKGGEPRKTTP